MARMIDLIRQSAVPSNVMRSASKGALTLPPGEIIEILVYLTTNAVFAKDAAMTLAGWDEKSCLKVLADPQTPFEVTNYFLDPKNRRPKLLPALVENPSVREAILIDLAQSPSREIIDMMLASKRVRGSTDILHALGINPNITDQEKGEIEMALRDVGLDTVQIHAVLEPVEEVADEEGPTAYELENAAAIAAEEAAGKTFELLGPIDESTAEPAAPSPAPVEITPAEVQATIAAALPAAEMAVATAPALEAAPVPAEEKSQTVPEEKEKVTERVSVLQKIARLSVGQREQLAMRGNKEERSILIRDGSRLVSSAVLVSPKVSEAEIENFAALKNVQDQVLRDIARNPEYKKKYTIIRNLANNPRTPLDLSLPLMNHLMVMDLKNLSMNKNVPETLRKIALKRFKEKSGPPGQQKG